LSSLTVSAKLRSVAEQAAQYPQRVFLTLAHLMDPEFLKEAFGQLKRGAAPGVDGVTWAEYAQNLDANVKDLYERMRTGRYRAQPVKRRWLPKDATSDRPIGITAVDDKVAQRAVAMLLETVYEPLFYDFAYGFRPGRGAHDALRELRRQALATRTTWILDADISSFFDSIDHAQLREVVQKRVNDGSIIRLIGKWLNAGVLEEGKVEYPEAGTPQGGVISPMLANIFLHTVLDGWFAEEVKPQLRGRSFIVRYADDFVIGFEREDDARRVMEELPGRFARFGLTIHPKKTRLVPFDVPPQEGAAGSEPGTFDFLGFTHYWGETRSGGWTIKRMTRRSRLSRALSAAWEWCKEHRHDPMRKQYDRLCSKLRGHYQYYGVRCNYRSLWTVFQSARRAWRTWLTRRCNNARIPWEEFQRKYMSAFPLPRPRIVHADV
jgi:RNA-directed DNA polymerase